MEGVGGKTFSEKDGEKGVIEVKEELRQCLSWKKKTQKAEQQRAKVVVEHVFPGLLALLLRICGETKVPAELCLTLRGQNRKNPKDFRNPKCSKSQLAMQLNFLEIHLRYISLYSLFRCFFKLLTFNRNVWFYVDICW